MRQPAAPTATRGSNDLAQSTTAWPAETDGAAGPTAAAEWAAKPRQRRARKRRGSGARHVPDQLMLRPLFVEESPVDEVLATVRAESAGITPRSGMWPAAIVAAVAVMTIVLLAAGLILAMSG